MSAVVDTSARIAAVDPLTSVCVSAPAGSGKTELLIQRFLCLLSRVQRPEQVLAITFTRKAAAEMRERVTQALQDALADTRCDSPHQQITRRLANKALAADRRGAWQLLGNISRFNIKTIDSFCSGLTRQMPVLSQFGGQLNVRDDVTPLYTEAVQALYKLLDGNHPISEDLAVLLLHFDNNWERLQTLLVAMLGRREQWRDYVGVHHQPTDAEEYLIATVDALIRDELEYVSRLLRPHRAELLELLQYAAGNLHEPALESFPHSSAKALDAWSKLRTLVLTKKGQWRKTITNAEGFPPGTGDPKKRKLQWLELLQQLQEIEGLEASLAATRSLPVIEAEDVSWQLVLHLSRLLPTLAAQLLLVFQQHGVVDHSQVAQSALLALGDDDTPTELALRLDYQIEHILVDEFQDTAITQYELLHKLTRGWGEHNQQNPEAPRTLMIVGDGMQSIYGFRGANVGLFLRARREGFNGVSLKYLKLRCNFRSQQGIVDWVNEAFGPAFPAANDVYRSQVRYSPATAVRPPRSEPAVTLQAFHGDSSRAQEVAFIMEQILDCVRSSDETIAILGRSRSHLQPVIRQLKQLGIPYNAPDLDSLAQSPAVADLLTLCRALSSDADRLAWMALLRAPWCGLQLDDLLCIAQAGEATPYTPVWSVIQQADVQHALSEDGRTRLLHVLPALHQARAKYDRLSLRVWIEQAWLELGGPQCAPGHESLLDVESFMQLLEQAEAEGIGLDFDWLALHLQKSFMNTGNAGGQIQLMTLHKAKGLEFDRVIIPQLDKLPRSDDRDILLWDEHSNADGERSFLLAADDHSSTDTPTLYNYLQLQRRQKSILEATRLLYVGATRAVNQLLLTATVKLEPKTGLPREPSSLSLLKPIWQTFSRQMIVSTPADMRHIVPTKPARRLLTRLLRETPSEQGFTADVSRQDTPQLAGQPANSRDRIIGNTVHLALEELSRLETLPAAATEADHTRWRMALQRQGLRGEVLDAALQSVLSAINRSLQDGGDGRWLLDSQHSEAYSEWSLTTANAEGKIRDIVIDRSFVDSSTDVRWVIDYKNSQPGESEPFDMFAERESHTYYEQLLTYRDAVRFVGNQPIRCALFFTALGRLHIIDKLDLPAL